jgi:NAD(P)-dependent dehydrogenase (short-subunit alcohol dehydrogenase family)
MRERVAVIGGTSGIGLATARRLADAGRDLAVTGRNPERLAAALQQLPPDTIGAAVDATDVDAMSKFFADLERVDHVVVAATGGSAVGPFQDLEQGQLADAVNGKLLACHAVVKAARPVLRTSGSVTVVSAISAQTALPGSAALAAANAAVDAWVRVLAVEAAPIRVNPVSPGVVDTPWWDFLDDDTRRTTFESYAEMTPVKRVGTADDIAAAIRYLLESSFTTGVVLPCDGGVRLVGATG